MAEEIQKMFGDKCKTYHSKMKMDIREKVLSDYSQGQFSILSAVDGLNEGLSVDDVDAAICISGVSTILTNTQQLGRVIRQKEGKANPVFFNLYSKDTVEKNWVENKTLKGGLGPYTQWLSTSDIKDLDSLRT